MWAGCGVGRGGEVVSAGLLREAAALMRERAMAAKASDGAEAWEAIPAINPEDNGWIVAHAPSMADYDTTTARAEYDYEGEVSQHIASWHPVVALAVADWLDSQADLYDDWSNPDSVYMPDLHAPSHDAAIRTARAYLGRDA